MATHTTKPTEHKDLDIGDMYTSTEMFFEKNKRAVTIGIVAIIAVVGCLIGYKKFVMEPNAKAAENAMWKAQYWFEIDSLDLAINGDVNYPGFQGIANKYGSTPSGELAHYYLGVCYHEKGELETALKYYKEADLGDDLFSVLTIGNQGDVLVDMDKVDEAIKQFEKAANMQESLYTTPMFLMKAGIAYQSKNDWKGAEKCFSRIATDFPQWPDVMTARKYAARAKAMSGSKG